MNPAPDPPVTGGATGRDVSSPPVVDFDAATLAVGILTYRPCVQANLGSGSPRGRRRQNRRYN